jgi:hypothetical protein
MSNALLVGKKNYNYSGRKEIEVKNTYQKNKKHKNNFHFFKKNKIKIK